MKKSSQDKINLDLDVVNLAKIIKGSKEESVFYFRTDGGRVFLAMEGHSYCLAHGFLLSFLNDTVVMNIVAEALARYEEETFWCEECQKAYHKEEVSGGVCPECGGVFSE